jgi:hypothetical protein
MSSAPQADDLDEEECQNLLLEEFRRQNTAFEEQQQQLPEDESRIDPFIFRRTFF